MNCFKCQTPLPDGAKFCFTCGTDVSGEHGHERTLAVDADPELQLKLQADVGTEYVIEKELGRGGMAIVFLGHDAHLGRKVAVKLLPPELTFGSGGSVIERFKREARTSATLDHPNIIPVYRVSQGKNLFWYVMKFLEGEGLDSIIEREGQLAVDRTVDIVKQAADALDYAHEYQVIHRDIKPANLMIDARGRVTVTDFGIAKALDANTLTASGSMIGTPYFMSPEQCAGKRVGPGSDQYSLAVMTYLMLGGHLPFTGESVVDIIRKHVMDPVPPLGVLRPQLPAALVRAVERALAKAPEERFASCNDFAKALAQSAQGLDVTVAPPSKPSSARASKTALVSPVPGALRTAKGASKGRKVLLAVGVVGVAGALAIGAVIALGRVRAAQQQPGGQAEGTQGADSTPHRPLELAAADSGTQPQAVAAAPVAAPAAPAASPPRTTSRSRDRNANVAAKRPVTPPGAATPVTQAAPAAPARDTGRAAPAAAAPAAAATASGFITVGSRPPSAITINGRAVAGNPVTDYEVQAGNVTIRFTVTDATGVWTVDYTYQVAAGEHKNLHRIQLTHP